MKPPGLRCPFRMGLVCSLLAAGAVLPARAASTPADTFPHLERRGHATQLIVEGQPWLMLGAELRGMASSNLVNREPIWPEPVQLHLNTVLLALGWDWTEPQEGQFDFSPGLLPGTPQIQRVRVYRYQ
jgi:hypothetical protein